jgi:hypothetical protein
MVTSASVPDLDITVSLDCGARNGVVQWTAIAFPILPSGQTGDMAASGVGSTRSAALANLAQQIDDDSK